MLDIISSTALHYSCVQHQPRICHQVQCYGCNRVLVCSLQLSMHAVAATAVPDGLLVTQCQLALGPQKLELGMLNGTLVVCD